MASFQDDRGLNGDYHDRGSCMLCLEMEQLQKRKEEHQISTGDGLLFTRNCKFCGGRLLYKNARVCEPHGQCCGPNGKYRAKLEEYEPRIFEPIPWEIQEHWRTKIDLRKRTRKYQQLFCISSIGTNTLGRKGFETHHPGGITLHGATYHVVRNPDESCAGNKRNPLHWLLYDSDERGNQDPAYGPPIAEDFIQSMQSLLSKHNAVVHGFEFVDPNDCVGKTMTLRRTPGGTSEVAVLIGEEARGFDPREIVIKRADGVHAQIPAMSSFWEPLQYTLLNPRGIPGWGLDMKQKTGLSILQYTKVVLFSKLGIVSNPTDSDGNPRHDFDPNEVPHSLAGGLLNQYMLDQYSRMEDLNAAFLKRGTMQQRLAQSRVLEAAAESMSSASVGTVFMPKRAPGTHYRSSQDAQNALTLSNKRGKANVFVTTTMNPSDVEVQRHLKEGQVPSDRFDVINRVFSLKVNLLVYCTPRIPFELTTTSATRYRITDISRCRNSTTT